MRSATEGSKRPIEQSWKQTKFRFFLYVVSKNNFFSNQKRWEAAHLPLP